MNPRARDRLVAIGAVWGFVLSAVPAIVMTRPFAFSGFLVAAVAGAVVCGVLATLYAGLRASRSTLAKRDRFAWLGAGIFQGLVGGALGAVLIWVIMAVSISGFSGPDGLSGLMRPAVFIGSFFGALSAFLYVLTVGILLSPVFGGLINAAVGYRTVEGGKA